MKLIIASDIHGGYKNVEKLFERMDEFKPDKLLLLGDLLYHGPRNDLPEYYDTVKTSDLLNEKKGMIMAVRGNCDADVDQYLLTFNIESQNLLLNVDGLTIFITHGHYYNKAHLPQLSSYDVLLHGHTHIPVCEEIGKNIYYMNPGSLTIPKGDSKNSYMTYENRKFTWYDLDGNKYKEFSF